MGVDLIREMFEQMVLKKDPDLIERFYSPDFEMHSNGVVQGFEEFAAAHRRVYATDISYEVEYDEDAWVEQEGRVAGRVWITTKLPGREATRIEVILIARIEDDRITRIWETTWPDWQNLREMERYEAP